MAVESVIVAQLVRLFRGHPGVVWELIDASHPPRSGDVALRDLEGVVVAYARSGAPDAAVDRAAAKV